MPERCKCCHLPSRSNGFCGTHDAQFRRGIIDGKGNKLREKYSGHEGCVVEGCEGIHYGRGFCKHHHAQFREGMIDESGQPLRERKRRYTSVDHCVAIRCEEPPVARGFCTRHYQQFKKGQIDETGRQIREVQEKHEQGGAPCCVDGCDQLARSRGFCGKHYQEWRRGSIDSHGARLRDLTRVGSWAGLSCIADGCSAPAKTKGLCNKHYRQLRDGIIDETGAQLRPLKSKSDPRQARKGYRVVNRGYIKRKVVGHPHADQDGYVLEHRLVMEEHLGRYLEPNEVVHHIDGVRDHNELSNLQLRRSRADHGYGHEPTGDIDAAMELLDRVVNHGMTGGTDLRKQLTSLARRLPKE